MKKFKIKIFLNPKKKKKKKKRSINPSLGEVGRGLVGLDLFYPPPLLVFP